MYTDLNLRNYQLKGVELFLISFHFKISFNRNFRSGGKWCGNFFEEFSKNSKFPKCEPRNRKF